MLAGVPKALDAAGGLDRNSGYGPLTPMTRKLCMNGMVDSGSLIILEDVAWAKRMRIL